MHTVGEEPSQTSTCQSRLGLARVVARSLYTIQDLARYIPRIKSSVMLMIYGARYKPDKYRAKIWRINEKKSSKCGAREGRVHRDTHADVASPRGSSSAADALFGMFGL